MRFSEDPPDVRPQLIVVSALDESNRMTLASYEMAVESLQSVIQDAESRELNVRFAVIDYVEVFDFGPDIIIPSGGSFPAGVVKLASSAPREPSGDIVDGADVWQSWIEPLLFSQPQIGKLALRMDISNSMRLKHWRGVPEQTLGLMLREFGMPGTVEYSEDERWVNWFLEEYAKWLDEL